ncbi:hypothetical protein A2777_03215 [Candidatus Gottesmanbacteria bacterium RIFCSPHIGHO2_01_FULL_40_15]|uniref:Glycosyltransferase RgtA/B/C/D-like domain-containing protein n=1 Tax=Candidatus Gottesmanbacteria bacterium RIFCSPHIGHO2_01_FULL_40_15 TaxID=1798376 RepID=A0A1F5Z650_9BACT|nr:MAG: hypothetical protein A2777_03215 [Candidatus Gottesmanbacteria bacterium RIFCSPHIGHO2_01_FULL_40_15]
MKQQNDKCLIFIYSLIFLFITTFSAHTLFSWIGFNPTDDGTVLAGAKRILVGQIPYKDFISIRLPGSYYLHAPFLIVGTQYSLWLSRLFTWFEFALIVWFWVIIITIISSRNFKISWSIPLFPIIWAVIGFAFTSHNFPIMPWHSIDGLVFASLGLLLISRSVTKKEKLIGYFFLGTSVLFRQNFILLLPLILILNNDWLDITMWSASLASLGFMTVYLLITGAFFDALIQLSAQTDILGTGFFSYLRASFLFIFVISFLINSLFLSKKKFLSIVGFLLNLIFLLYLSYSLGNGHLFAYRQSFYVFWFFMGLFGYLLFNRNQYIHLLRTIGASICLGWVTSISIGYNTPALVSCVFIIILLSLLWQIADKIKLRFLYSCFLFLMFLITMKNYIYIRNYEVYRDLSVNRLTFNLGDVLKSGKYIKTNANTYDFLLDLNNAIKKVGIKKYAIIPDLAVYWISSTAINPLPIDWVQGQEIINTYEKSRILNTLQSFKKYGVIIVQKYSAGSIATKVEPLPNTDVYELVSFVRNNFKLIGETKYFYLYQ